MRANPPLCDDFVSPSPPNAECLGFDMCAPIILDLPLLQTQAHTKTHTHKHTDASVIRRGGNGPCVHRACKTVKRRKGTAYSARVIASSGHGAPPQACNKFLRTRRQPRPSSSTSSTCGRNTAPNGRSTAHPFGLALALAQTQQCQPLEAAPAGLVQRDAYNRSGGSWRLY